MKWTLVQPRAGDIVRVDLGGYFHYGIFLSDDEVVQFGLPPAAARGISPDKIAVLSTDAGTFCCGNFLETGIPDRSERKKMRSRQAIAAYARAQIGRTGYHILYNNCEHFVYECAFGVRKSAQIEELRQKFRRLPLLDVYVAALPDAVSEQPLFPLAREEEVVTCSHAGVRLQKRFVWQLLAFAMRRSLHLELSETDLHRTSDGKWVCSDCRFSLSHSQRYAAVAVSRAPVGVDIEDFSRPRFTQALYDKIACPDERASVGETPSQQAVAALWTAKESAFKCGDAKCFLPHRLNTTSLPVYTAALFGGAAVCSVCCDEQRELAFYRVTSDEPFSAEPIVPERLR